MFGVQYPSQLQRYSYKPSNQFSQNPNDDIDYSFTQQSVQERRKMFMNDSNPPTIFQQGSIPRIQKNFRTSRFDSQSDMGDWNAPVRRAWIPNTSTLPRPSSYREPAISRRSIQLTQTSQQNSAPRQFRSNSNVFKLNQQNDQVYEEPIQSLFVAPRQSRPLYRPEISPPIIRNEEFNNNYATPSTRVIPSRRLSYSSVPRQRETVSMCREVWPSTQPSVSVGQPLRVRVYNSDRPAYSPEHSHNTLNWRQNSAVYPAYPAYGPRSIDGNTQVYRVVQSPTKVLSKNAEQYTYYSSPTRPAYVPLSVSDRRSTSDQKFEKKSITIYPEDSKPKSIQRSYGQQYQRQPLYHQQTLNQPSNFRQAQPQNVQQTHQKQSRENDWVPQPIKYNPVKASLISNQQRPYSQQTRQVVNRREHSTEDIKGVSEF